jgi:hypothetical protein
MFSLLGLNRSKQLKLGRSNPDGPTKLRTTDYKLTDHHHGKSKVRVLRVRQVRALARHLQQQHHAGCRPDRGAAAAAGCA